MQILKGYLLTVAMVIIVSFVAVAGTASAVTFVRHNGGLWVAMPTNLREITSATPHFENTVALPDGQDWTQYRFDVLGTGMNPEGHILAQNVPRLARQWTVGSRHGFTSTPAIVNGIIYVTNGNYLDAFELASGQTVWNFHNISQPHGDTTSAVAVDPSSHLAYYGTADARVYAVNTLTGTGVWTIQLGNPDAGAFIWSSPLLANGKVYIGLASHDDHPCVRGAVFALDAATGKVDWTHYMVQAGALGGSVWSSLTANPSAHEVIATTGNPCPEGKSDNQQDAFVGMDWDTGATRWHYTAVAYDDCDCDFGEGAVDYVYHGQEYLVAGNKNGMVYALTPQKGHHGVRLVWSLRITRTGPWGYGGIFEPATYSNGLVFIAGGPTLDGTCRGGALYALQADTGAVRWRVCTSGQVVSPASTTGDVLFVAQKDVLVAYESATGHKLWQAKQHGTVWGGVSISRGSVVVGTISGTLYCYSLPDTMTR